MKNSSDLGYLVRTVYEADILLGEVRLLMTSFYKSEDDFGKALTKNIRGASSNFIKKLTDKSEDKLGVLKNLEKEIQELPRIHLIVGFEPNDETITKIHTWLRSEVSSNLILDLVYDYQILGGAIIEYQGKFADYSTKKKISDFFYNQKAEIDQILKS